MESNTPHLFITMPTVTIYVYKYAIVPHIHGDMPQILSITQVLPINTPNI